MDVIFNADDFGVSIGTNKAIEKAFQKGVLTSATVRTNGVAFKDAIRRIKNNKGLAVGLHLNLTDGTPHTKAMFGANGLYRHQFIYYLFKLGFGDEKLLKEVKEELLLQFEIIRETGIKIDHVDGQEHIHMIPEIFELSCLLSRKYGISRMRVSNEPLSLGSGILKAIALKILSLKNKSILKKYKLVTTDAYFGVTYTNNMTEKRVIKLLQGADKRHFKKIEIALHPAFPHDPEDKKYTSPFFAIYSNLSNRKAEFKTLVSKKLKQYIKEKNISLISFSDL